jgi:hypothetical protein
MGNSSTGAVRGGCVLHPGPNGLPAVVVGAVLAITCSVMRIVVRSNKRSITATCSAVAPCSVKLTPVSSIGCAANCSFNNVIKVHMQDGSITGDQHLTEQTTLLSGSVKRV